MVSLGLVTLVPAGPGGTRTEKDLSGDAERDENQ